MLASGGSNEVCKSSSIMAESFRASGSDEKTPWDDDGGPRANVTVVTPPSSEVEFPIMLLLLLDELLGSTMLASFKTDENSTLR